MKFGRLAPIGILATAGVEDEVDAELHFTSRCAPASMSHRA